MSPFLIIGADRPCIFVKVVILALKNIQRFLLDAVTRLTQLTAISIAITFEGFAVPKLSLHISITSITRVTTKMVVKPVTRIRSFLKKKTHTSQEITDCS